MRKCFCALLCMVLIFGTLPALAAENAVTLDGGGIVIDADTLSTVWTDQTGGTLTWNKDTGTLTFNDFNYNVSAASQNAGGGFCFETVSDIVLNGTSEISCSDKVYRTVRLENCPKISGSGKLTVKGPVIEPGSAEKMFPQYSAAYIEAVGGSFILNSGTLEIIGGTLACDSSAEVMEYADTAISCGVSTYSTIRVNGGHLIAVGGSASGRKFLNESVGINAGQDLIIAGGKVTASGKTYGATGSKLTFPQYSEGSLYAVGEKSGVGFDEIDEGIIARGAADLNAAEQSVDGEISKRDAHVVATNDDGSVAATFNRYEYLTDGALAKTIVARRDNERKVTISDSGAELSGDEGSSVSFTVTAKNIRTEEIFQIEWTDSTPSGITASFADDKLTFTSDGTTNRGVYPFKIAFGDGENRVESNESALSVGSFAAKVVCENKSDAYFDTFPGALAASSLSENSGCKLLLLGAVSDGGDIMLSGDITLDLNGYDIECNALIVKNGACVWGSGNVSAAEIGDGGTVGGGTYGTLSVTDGKTITDHLAQDVFCTQIGNENTDGLYWDEFSQVKSMNNANLRYIPFTADVDNLHTKFGYEINISINLHETPYYTMSNYELYKLMFINEDGSESLACSASFGGGFQDYDIENKVKYSVKDRTVNYNISKDIFPEEGTYRMYAVLGKYFTREKVIDEGRVVHSEQYLMRTQPFMVTIGNGTPSFLAPGDVSTKYHGVISWNGYPYYTYTGAPQQIVHSLPSNVCGGVLQYRFNENDDWTVEVPTATEPGKYTFQCRIKGNDGFNDLALSDGYAIINAAELVNDTADEQKDWYFVSFSDALTAAQKEENEGRVLKLYYPEKNGFELNGGKVKLALTDTAAVGDIKLGGSACLETEYGTFGNNISVDGNANLRINGGTFLGGIDVNGGSAEILGGTFEKITVTGGKTVADLLADGKALQTEDGTVVNMYTDKISQRVSVAPHTHDLGEIGTCDCGYETKAIDSDNDGAVEISTVGQLQWFAYRINCGDKINAVLTNDIDLGGKSVIIGTAEKPFGGVFDGKGAKITNYALTASENNMGLFGVVNGGTVKNFSILGTITVNGKCAYIGGVAGRAKGGAMISDIVSDVDILGSEESSHIGGIVGSTANLSGSLNISKCIYSGTINMPNVSDCLGGIIGYANESVTVSYCGFVGKSIGKGGVTVGGILGYVNNSDFGGIKNSFAAGYTNGNALIGMVKKCSDSIKNCVYTTGATPFGGTGAGEHSAESVSEWNTGLAAYLLNGGLHDNTYIWRQTIGKDDFPNFSGSKVYRSGKNSFISEKPSAFVFTDGSTVTAEQIDKPCVLIAASYSGDKLTDVKIKNISENTNLTFDEMNLNRQNADSICVMLWNERENMTPLCGADKFIVE